MCPGTIKKGVQLDYNKFPPPQKKLNRKVQSWTGVKKYRDKLDEIAELV